MDYAKGRLLQQLREAARYLFGFFKIPDAPAAAENQAGQHAEEADHEEQQRGARALSCAEQGRPQAAGGLRRHERLEDAVHEEAAGEVAERDREELQRVARRVNAPLHPDRDARAQEHVHVGVHQRDGDPPELGRSAPDGQRMPERKQEVFGAHRKQQGVADHAHAAFRRGQQRDKQTAREHGEPGAGVHGAERALAAVWPREQHGGERGVVNGGDQVDRGEKEDQKQNAAVLGKVAQAASGGAQHGLLFAIPTAFGDADEKEQRAEGQREGEQVQREHGAKPEEAEHRRCGDRRQDGVQGARKRTQPARALKVPLWDQQRRSDLRRRIYPCKVANRE